MWHNQGRLKNLHHGGAEVGLGAEGFLAFGVDGQEFTAVLVNAVAGHDELGLQNDFSLRPLMFARRLTFLRLWACLSRCLPALDAGSPLMHEKGTLSLCLHRTLTWPRASPDECSLSGQAFAVAFLLGHIDPIVFYRKSHINLFKILL